MNLNPLRFLRRRSLNDHNKKVFSVLLRRHVIEMFFVIVIVLFFFGEVFGAGRVPVVGLNLLAVFVMGHVFPFYVRDRVLKWWEGWKLKRVTRRDDTHVRVHIRD